MLLFCLYVLKEEREKKKKEFQDAEVKCFWKKDILSYIQILKSNQLFYKVFRYKLHKHEQNLFILKDPLKSIVIYNFQVSYT